MKLEDLTRRPGIMVLPALANLIFFIVLNMAGTKAGYSGLSQARPASIRLRRLYTLNVSICYLLLPSTVGTFCTLLLRLALIHQAVPYRHWVDIVLAAGAAFFLLITAITITSNTMDVRDCVNDQHAQLVYDARLGGS